MYHFKNPDEKIATISNLDCFLHRSLDTGFKTKWSGLWKPPYKLLDYYSYKINGIWLNKDNLEAVDYGEDMVFHFQTESFYIKEVVRTPENTPGVTSTLLIENKLEEKKAVQATLEVGADIRKRDQDIGEEDYKVERNSERVKISNGEELKIISDREMHSTGDSYIKEHYPGEKQRCLVPGEIKARCEIEPNEKEEIEFEFLSGTPSDHVISQKDQELNGELGRTFRNSVNSMENLIYDRAGLGVIAGHPWFQNYWARDSFWTALGLVDAGYFEEAKLMLENFAEKGLPGKINVGGGKEEKGRPDTYPLFILAADKLKRHHEISEKISSGMEKAMEHLETEEGLVVHEESGTWMDTLNRKSAIDIQCLWIKAAEIMGEDSKNLYEGLEKFKEDGYVKDSMDNNSARTINPAVGIMFDILGGSYLSKINAEFSSRYGARTRAVTDPGYDSSGYHTGSSWGLTTCWAAMANLEQGKTVEGVNFLEKLENLVDEDQPGALPELVDSETGESLGCPEQAWSAGLLVHAIDSYLLGITVTEDEVRIDPSTNFTGTRKNKRVGEAYIDIRFEEGNPEIINDPDLDRELIL